MHVPAGISRKRKGLGPDHKRTLDTRYYLAELFEEKSLLEDAAKHFELVLQGYIKLFGPERISDQ